MNIFSNIRKKTEEKLPGPNFQKFTGEGTVLMSYCKNLGNISPTPTPEGLVAVLNNHIEHQIDVIRDYSGGVIQFAIDRVLAYWTIEQTKNHARIAIEAAQNMLKDTSPSIDYCVVVSSGKIIADYFGGPKTLQFQIFGKAMNNANKLTKFHHELSRSLLTTERTIEICGSKDLKIAEIGHMEDDFKVYSVLLD
jgi:class 3 adenylate cyclase